MPQVRFFRNALDVIDGCAGNLGNFLVAQIRRVQHIVDDGHFFFCLALAFSFLDFFFLDFSSFFSIPLEHHHE